MQSHQPAYRSMHCENASIVSASPCFPLQEVKAKDDPDLVTMETDDALFKDPGFR